MPFTLWSPSINFASNIGRNMSGTVSLSPDGVLTWRGSFSSNDPVNQCNNIQNERRVLGATLHAAMDIRTGAYNAVQIETSKITSGRYSSEIRYDNNGTVSSPSRILIQPQRTLRIASASRIDSAVSRIAADGITNVTLVF
ncbi:hypothetical protein [Aquimonas voraii]|uniref:hypothetical protein n=1 Tax=Aquimonas voraii TaxID=265719 RepID=UPI00115FB2C1|nr:hypothetical protein [Aquimonas voraii]